MSSAEVDAYIASQGDPQREMLEQARAVILSLHPEAQEIISYAMPAFKVDDVIVAGFAATKSGISYYPHSGSVLSAAGDAVAGFSQTKGALHIPFGGKLSTELASTLINLKLALARG